MDKQELISYLSGSIGDYLARQGLELVELICRQESMGLVIKIIADRPGGGINLDECARISREAGQMLDEMDTLGGRYILEVSSPGLDRPLATRNDFLRCLNRKVMVFLVEPLNARIQYDGIIRAVTQDTLELEVKGEIVQIPLAKINKGKQTLDTF